ncbi:hypothetical protein, partial [Candidatus Venteria ishoeyi]|uniref:hypothetical protein n=1 Tax=Candidatus Venteria ishoeyi TaxID=1899563 RepID=UPI00255D1582
MKNEDFDFLDEKFKDKFRKLWNKNKYSWKDVRSTKPSDNNAELLNSVIPSALIELAFHDTEKPDSLVLRNEFLKERMAQGMFNGIEEYFNTYSP